MLLNTYVSTDFCFHLASTSLLIVLAVFSFAMLLDFADFVTWLVKFTLNLDLKSQFKSLTISLVTSWRTADFCPSKSYKKAFLRYALVLIGNFYNTFLYIRSLRQPWQSVGECLAFLSCSRLIQESVENIDKTDFFAAGSFFPKDLMFSMIFGNLSTNALQLLVSFLQ